jgi:hypothetical protein
MLLLIHAAFGLNRQKKTHILAVCLYSSPLIPVLLKNMRWSDTSIPRIERYLDHRPAEAADQCRHGGVYTELEAVQKFQALWR